MQDAKELMDSGWKARENLDFNNAETLLKKAKAIFESEQDWFNVTECLNHLSYNEKLKAYHMALKGYDYAKEAYDIAKVKGTKKVLVLRALMSLSAFLGNYEAALKYAEESLGFFKDPLPKADILSHAATFKLRCGNLNTAETYINEALDLIDEGWDSGKEPFRSIWKSRALLVKGLVSFNNGELSAAKEYGNRALELAKEKDLKTRSEEIEQFLELF